MTDFVRLIATPENMGAKGRLYSVAVEGGPTLGKSRDPLFAGARMLLEAGYSPEATVVVRNSWLDHDSFEPVTIGRAAKFTTSEPDRGSVRVRRFEAGRPGVGAPQISAIGGSDGSGQPGKPGAVYEATEDVG